jgi:GNAT superfamily N-acetyltransferase
MKAAQTQDVFAIADLLAELDAFYGDTSIGTREERVTHINEALFSEAPDAHALLAWQDSTLAGLATYTYVWPATGVTKSLYLKELYVTEKYRTSGIGKRLMQNLAQMAVANGCSRVEWTTDSDNPGAIKFYESLQVPQRSSKLFYRLDGQGLLSMANP